MLSKLAMTEHLHDVPAVLRLERLADLVVFERIEHLFELRHEGVGPVQPRSPPSTAEPGSSECIWARPAKSSPLRMRSRTACQLLLDGRIVRELGGLDENMARVDLVLDRRGLPPRTSFKLMMWNPVGVRNGSLTSPGLSLATTSVRNVGSSLPLRQPSAPPSKAVWLLEYATASLAKSWPALAFGTPRWRAWRPRRAAPGSPPAQRRSGCGRRCIRFAPRDLRLLLDVLVDLARCYAMRSGRRAGAAAAA